MKKIYVNLKRFDIPKELGGVNSLAAVMNWAEAIVSGVDKTLKEYLSDAVEIVFFFPEAHLLNAVNAKEKDSILRVGCQGVYEEDVATGKNFGAFTTLRTAKAMTAMGVKDTIIGHCEERKAMRRGFERAKFDGEWIINEMLNAELLAAQDAGMNVLYCIGETSEQRDSWKDVLRQQLSIGLSNVNLQSVVIGYEPVWAIGPGKTPPDASVIEEIVGFIKEETGGLPVVYGGGLKVENAKQLSGIRSLDGGLIALTRFHGDIGFYPEEFLEIVELYMGAKGKGGSNDEAVI